MFSKTKMVSANQFVKAILAIQRYSSVRHSPTNAIDADLREALVRCGQGGSEYEPSTNRLITHLLEPRGSDSYVSRGFFAAVLEQKEYAENYVLEQIAPTMLAKNPALKAEFEQILASDSSFAKSPEQRLQFFYERSSYWDEQLNVYPIGKVAEKVELPLQ